VAHLEALAHSPFQMPLSVPISVSRELRRRRWWRGEKGARRPGPEGKAPRNALSATSCAVSCAASFTCSSLAHRPRTIVWGGTRVLGMGSAAGR